MGSFSIIVYCLLTVWSVVGKKCVHPLQYHDQHNICLHNDIAGQIKWYPARLTTDAHTISTTYTAMANAMDGTKLDMVLSNGHTTTIQCPVNTVVVNGACTSIGARSLRKNSLKRLCYYTNWSRYHIGFEPKHIPTDLCTHIVYAFFPVLDNGHVALSDGWADIQLEGIQNVMKLRGQGYVESIILSIGGWTYSGPDKGAGFDIHAVDNKINNQQSFRDIWANIMKTHESRKNFISSIISIKNYFGFDGVEIDLEYPVCPWGECLPEFASQKTQFVSLIQELRGALGDMVHISIATNALPATVAKGPDLSELIDYVDFLSIMTYDYFVYQPNGKTGHNQPKKSILETLDYYLNDLHINPEKILLGVSMYGRGYKVTPEIKQSAIGNKQFTGLETIGPSDAMPFTQQPGVASFAELCAISKCTVSLKTTTDCCMGDKVLPNIPANCRMGYFSDTTDGSWLVVGNDVFAYTDILDLKELREIANSKKLGGYLVYSVDQDDYKGVCKLPGGTFPILRALVGANIPNHNFL